MNSYKILAPKIADQHKDPAKASGAILETTGLDQELYRLGKTKACKMSFYSFLKFRLDETFLLGFFLFENRNTKEEDSFCK